MHKIPVLWRIHRVHHTDTALDVSTTVRFHPLEFIVSVPIVIAAVTAAGVPPWVIMLYELFDAVMAVFSHANLRLPGGRQFGRRRLEQNFGRENKPVAFDPHPFAPAKNVP